MKDGKSWGFCGNGFEYLFVYFYLIGWWGGWLLCFLERKSKGILLEKNIPPPPQNHATQPPSHHPFPLSSPRDHNLPTSMAGLAAEAHRRRCGCDSFPGHHRASSPPARNPSSHVRYLESRDRGSENCRPGSA